MPLPDDLQKLHNLREQGALAEEEFIQAKKRLLDAAAGDTRSRTERPCDPAHGLNQLRRSSTDRCIGGVCGGLAETTGIPSWSWRILFVLAACSPALG